MEYWFTPNKKLTGQAIKEHRIGKGWSAAKLGEALGNYSDRTIYKWENGKSFPALENILKMAIILGTTAQDIALPKSIFRMKEDTAPSKRVLGYADYLLQKTALSWLSESEADLIDRLAYAGIWSILPTEDYKTEESPSSWITAQLEYEFGPGFKANINHALANKVINWVREHIMISEAISDKQWPTLQETGILVIRDYPENFKTSLSDYDDILNEWSPYTFGLKGRLYSRFSQCGVTPKQCAIAIGVSESSLSQWQSGFSYPKTEKFALLLSYLGFTFDPLTSLMSYFHYQFYGRGDYELYHRFLALIRGDIQNRSDAIQSFIASLSAEERSFIVLAYENAKNYFDDNVYSPFIRLFGKEGFNDEVLFMVMPDLGLRTRDGQTHGIGWWVSKINELREEIWSPESGVELEGIQECAFELLGSDYALWIRYLRTLGKSEIKSLLERFDERQMVSSVNNRIIYGLLLATEHDVKLCPIHTAEEEKEYAGATILTGKEAIKAILGDANDETNN